MMNGWHTGMGWGLGGGLFSIILIAGAIVGIVFIARWIVSKNGPISVETSKGKTPQSAEEILKGRYAKGEISREEYHTMREELQ